MPRKLLPAVVAGLTVLLVGCSGSGDSGDDTNPADTLTRRQKNEIISTLPVPGARGVGKALEVSDALKVRADRHDSLAGGR